MIFALAGLGMLGNLINTFANVMALWQALQQEQMQKIAKRLSEKAAAGVGAARSMGGGIARSMASRRNQSASVEEGKESSQPILPARGGGGAKVHPEGVAEPGEQKQSAFQKFQSSCCGGFLVLTVQVFVFQIVAAAIVWQCEKEENGGAFDGIWTTWCVALHVWTGAVSTVTGPIRWCCLPQQPSAAVPQPPCTAPRCPSAWGPLSQVLRRRHHHHCRLRGHIADHPGGPHHDNAARPRWPRPVRCQTHDGDRFVSYERSSGPTACTPTHTWT